MGISKLIALTSLSPFFLFKEVTNFTLLILLQNGNGRVGRVFLFNHTLHGSRKFIIDKWIQDRADLNIITLTTTAGLNAHLTKLHKMLFESQHWAKKVQFQKACIILSVHPGNSSVHHHARGLSSYLPRIVSIYIQILD